MLIFFTAEKGGGEDESKGYKMINTWRFLIPAVRSRDFLEAMAPF